MEIAAITKAASIQSTLLPGLPQRVETDLDIVQVDVGGGVGQLSWSGLEMAMVMKPSRTLRQAQATEEKPQLKITKVKIKGGGEQHAFL